MDPQLIFMESFGELFREVQLKKLFPDAKYFVDCKPKMTPDEIVALYDKQKGSPDFDLNLFVNDHFIPPPEFSTGYLSENRPIVEHIEELWHVLKRNSMVHGGTLVHLPHDYIVPGGRFREIFYWDSYFTMLGLEVSGHDDLIESMINNFTYLIDQFGYIPNGNRTYFLSRSQPPFFSLMIELLAKIKGEQILVHYLPWLEKEYSFWMDGCDEVNSNLPTHRRVVWMDDDIVLNRYWDDRDSPRPEAFFEDSRIANASGRDVKEVQRHLRAACESGWDFSSRWLRVENDMGTIECAHIIPVDLNCLLLHLEETLDKCYALTGDEENMKKIQAAIERRHKGITRFFWDEERQFFFDYQFVDKKLTDRYTLAAVYPLFFRVADKSQAEKVAKILHEKFLCDGGLVTTPVNSGQQWDAPNGWAPLQWMAFKGLKEYELNELADIIKDRWINTCNHFYEETGKLMEKYNVMDLETRAGGGKYPNQDGFGWTNGVYLKLSNS